MASSSSQWHPSVIFIAKHSGKALDFSAGVNHATQNTINGGPGQVFTLVHVEEGFVNIVNKLTGNFLDVNCQSRDNGGEIIQYCSNGGHNQHWKLTDVGDGFVTLTARHSGKVLDVFGLSMEDGGKINQWDHNGGPNQHWKIQRVQSDTVMIRSKSSGHVFEAESSNQGATVFQRPDNGSDNQKFNIDPTSDGYYQLVHVPSGRALDAANNSVEEGTELILWDKHGGSNQQWKPISQPNGFFALQPRHVVEKGVNRVVAVPEGGDTTQNLRIWDFEGEYQDQQMFRFDFV